MLITMKRTDFIIDSISGRVLDIGCTHGGLHDKLTGFELHGIDVRIEKDIPNICKADAHNLPYRNSTFNSIVAGEIIEHLDDVDMFLKEAGRIMKTGGKLIITTPNRGSWLQIMFKSYCLRQDHGTGKNQLYTKNELEEMLEKNNFRIRKSFLLPYTEEENLGKRGRMFVTFRKIMHRIVPNRMRENIIILAEKSD